MKKLLISSLWGAAGVSASALLALAAPRIATAAVISASIPGAYDASNPSGVSPSAFVADFYQYALMIGGLLAFAVVVYGGIRYMLSAGNPSGQGDAREWIRAAIVGILLLAGAYFILKVINPDLVDLTLPDLSKIGASTTGTSNNASTSGNGGGGSNASNTNGGFFGGGASGGAGAGGDW